MTKRETAFAVLAAVGFCAAFVCGVRVHRLQGDLSDATALLDEARRQAGGGAQGGTTAGGAQAGESGGDAKGAEAAKPRKMEILGVSVRDGSQILVRLSEIPDVEAARSHVTVEPAPPGGLTVVACDTWDSGLDHEVPALRISGDFPFGSNLVLRVRAGFPAMSAVARSGSSFGVSAALRRAVVPAPLAEDFTYSFRRADLAPYVKFADSGRYLPPGGRREIAFKGMNAGKAKVRVGRVPPHNAVLVLALENDVYRNIEAWNGERFAGELASFGWESEVLFGGESNILSTAGYPFAPQDGGPSNGLFTVSISSLAGGSLGAFRIVCATDIGITARRGKGEVLVWANSLSTGQPVPGADVGIYTSAGVLAGHSITGIDGLCRCAVAEDAEPFAVVVSSADGCDASILAFSSDAAVDESSVAGGAPHLPPGGLSAFAWTERGIYRHGEDVFFQALVRDGTGKAPAPLPLEVVFLDAAGRVAERKTLRTDAVGALSHRFSGAAQDRPGGRWRIRVSTPGANGVTIGSASVKIEEFAPPQIRVAAAAAAGRGARDFAFDVSAENLYGGAATLLACEGAISFEDAAFSPAGWNGWRFGDASRALTPNFERIIGGSLDDGGRHRFEAPLGAGKGIPGAAVRAIFQGTVFEDGGRPATARGSAIVHFHPFYIGTTLPERTDAKKGGRLAVRIACVKPDGSRLGEARSLQARLERIESVYSCETDDDGESATWKRVRVNRAVVEDIAVEVPADGDGTLEVPVGDAGDYVLAVSDATSGVSFSQEFEVRGSGGAPAALESPSRIFVVADKPFYRPGETPRLRIRAPFAGTALLTVWRDGIEYAEVFDLENPSCEIALRPAPAGWSPSVDVSLNVVRGAADSGRLAAKAHGETTVSVRPPEREIAAEVSARREGRRLEVAVSAPGAAYASVSVVDEGINILTGEPVPDPAGYFARSRHTPLTLFDLHRRLFPVYGEGSRNGPLKASGAKTGGGAGAELFDRISPVPSRRFKPLALWKGGIPVKDGKATAVFELPEFSGEVRITAVAWSAEAAGSAAIREKVRPRLAMQPDAPRFAAPGDAFDAILPLANTTDADGEAEWTLSAAGVDGKEVISRSGRELLPANSRKILRFRIPASPEPGEMALSFSCKGFGESHEALLCVPVRPAVPWRETRGFAEIAPGGTFRLPERKGFSRLRWSVSALPASELKSALDWLADYPYGCLEQTSSQILPLVAAGGLMNALASDRAQDRALVVAAGVRRVESMVRCNGFTAWPDCECEPCDPEVPLFAAHFLAEAAKAGVRTDSAAMERVMGFLRRRAMSPTNSVSAYACHTLALAGRPERDRMHRLYDGREDLDLLSRARLARAFAVCGDAARAKTLLENAGSPSSVKEAAFALLALAETAPEDGRQAGLVQYLMSARDPVNLAWRTTAENSHALLALGEYWRRRPLAAGKPDVKEKDGLLQNTGDGTAYLSWTLLDLPDSAECREESAGLAIRRVLLGSDGMPWNPAEAKPGDLVVSRLEISADCDRTLADLAVEDLFPAALEPVHSGVRMPPLPGDVLAPEKWVVRSDARDDRMLVFSGTFHLEKGSKAVFQHPLRVVSSGEFVLPPASVEAMYAPELRARTGSGRVVSRAPGL